MIISFDVLDMGNMRSMLDNLWLVFGFLADGIFQFNNYDLFSDNASFDLEVFQKKEINLLTFISFLFGIRFQWLIIMFISFFEKSIIPWSFIYYNVFI